MLTAELFSFRGGALFFFYFPINKGRLHFKKRTRPTFSFNKTQRDSIQVLTFSLSMGTMSSLAYLEFLPP